MERKSFFLPILAPEKTLLTWVMSLIVLFLLPSPILGQTVGTLIIMENTRLGEDHQGNIIIDADNVTLDCRHFTVSGPGVSPFFGIELTGSRVTVKNCNVEGFNRGVVLFNSDNNKVTDNIAKHNVLNGFFVFHSDNNTFTNNISKNNVSLGFRISGSDNSTFTKNISENNGTAGYNVSASFDNTFTKNISENNGTDGFRISGSDNNTFTNNISKNNDFHGFFFLSFGLPFINSDNNTLTKNIANDNGANGFLVIGNASMNTFTRNEGCDNIGFDAEDLSVPGDNTWVDNNFCNPGPGI